MGEAARQLGLIQLALTCGLSNVIHWKKGLPERVRSDANLQGLTPGGIVGLLVEQVKSSPSCVCHHVEDRPGWRDEQDYWYEVLIPVEGLPRDLFVEVVLHEDDTWPEVRIVSCHLTSSPRGA